MFNLGNNNSTKISVEELTVKFYPFWEKYFNHYGIKEPVFKTKLCYKSKEFNDNPLAVRFFKDELNIPSDIYVELCDWSSNFYEPMHRKLYKLEYNPHWTTEPEKYARSNNQTHTTYAVRLTDLILLNETHITNNEVVILDKIEYKVKNEDYEIDEFKEDSKFSEMTLRDYYCIKHNIPLSGKEWLNKLIKQGIQWNYQKNQ